MKALILTDIIYCEKWREKVEVLKEGTNWYLQIANVKRNTFVKGIEGFFNVNIDCEGLI